MTVSKCDADDVSLIKVERIGLTPEQLERLKNNRSTKGWRELLMEMSAADLSGTSHYEFDAYHFAVAFVVTEDQDFADAAKQRIFRIIDEPGYCDVTENYWRAPDCTIQVSLASGILMDQLSNAEKNRVFDYLESNARNIVEVIGWSGWAWQEGNPGFRQLNNFYPGHLQTILSYALLAYENRPLAREYYQLVVEQELPAALELIRDKLADGQGVDGTWYDDELYNRYAEVVLMVREATKGKINYGFDYRDLFSNYLTFRLNTFGFNRKYLFDNLTTTGGDILSRGSSARTDVRFWLMMDVLGNPDPNEFNGYTRYYDPAVSLRLSISSVDDQLHYLMLR